MSAPKPVVLYLPAIFRTIRSGKTRIPAFQRGFVWRQKEILELLESVYKSYPVGSLLFWHADSKVMRTDENKELPFPHPPVEGDVDFVLDGMQRISALYGAFHENPSVPLDQDQFAIAFNLRDHKFVAYRDRTPDCISLRDIFSPIALIKEQGRLAELEDGETLVEQSLQLQQIFQEYLIPVVSIGDRTAEEVVEIFERVNSTGMKLSAVDFMRALTWSQAFDLTKELTEMSEMPELESYEVPPDTLAKSVALVMGIAPVSKEIVGLSRKTPAELIDAVACARLALARVSSFLGDKLGVWSYDYIPYEGQFLVLASVASALDDSSFPPAWLVPWFWIAGFSESFRGRPNPDIAKLALEARSAPLVPIKEHFSLSMEDLVTRTHRKGASLSMTTLMALATAPAHSIFSGKPIDAREFMDGYETASVAAVFSRASLEAVMQPAPRTDRIISNIILLSRSERRHRGSHDEIQGSILALAKTVDGKKALKSQCIDTKCVTAIKNDDCLGFLRARANALLVRARSLSGFPRK